MKKNIATDFTPEELEPALHYIRDYWRLLGRTTKRDDGTLIGLQNPYIVPSVRGHGHFSFEEQYYWDSYFVAQGLYGTARQKYAVGMLENLLEMMRRFGQVPNASRFYHLGHSQPPFLTSYILEVFELAGKSPEWLEEAIMLAKIEYARVWMSARHPHWRKVFRGLSRYYDINVLDDLAEAESGWDYNGRFYGKCLEYIPVDLNCLLYKYEKDFEYVALMLGDKGEADLWKRRARQRKSMMDKYLWDPRHNFYFDYNFITGKRSQVWSLAAYYALWSGLASNSKAEHLIEHLSKFDQAGGLTVTASESKSDPRPISLQWDYPNGWAPLHWITAKGLVRYGYREEADRIVRKWLRNNLAEFQEHGVFLERYNVVEPGKDAKEGVYPAQTGFGWTNAVFWSLAYTYLRSEELPSLPEAASLKTLLAKSVVLPPLKPVHQLINRHKRAK